MSVNAGFVLPLITAAAVASIAAPAAGVFYGSKSGAEKAIKNAFAVGAVATIAWGLFGFTEIFGPSLNGNIIGSALYGTINEQATIPLYSLVVFELIFALLCANLVASSVQHVIKPFYLVIITGAIVFGAFAPAAHWLWAPGNNAWLGLGPQGYGAVDWAGGITVHVIAGVAALVLGVLAGAKKPAAGEASHWRQFSAVALLLGTYFLNTGKGNAGLSLLNTQIAAFGGVASYAVLQVALPWTTGTRYLCGEATLEGVTKGAVIGLVSTSAGAGIILPMWTLLNAFIATLFIYVAEKVCANWASAGLEVFLVHGLGGALSATLTGLFAQGPQAFPGSIYPNGSFFYNKAQLGKQCAAVSVAVLLSGVVAYVVTKFVAQVAKVTRDESIFYEDAPAAAAEPAQAAVADVPAKTESA